MRPSGCSSYDPPQGGDGLTASPISGNVWYNSWRNVSEFFVQDGSGDNDDDDHGSAVAAAVAAAAAAGGGGGGGGTGEYSYSEDAKFTAGRVTRQCVGFPPPYGFDRAEDSFDALTVDDGVTGIFEDTGVGTTVRLACPTSCLEWTNRGQAGEVRGTPDFYTDDSAVCMAAIHAGVMSATTPTSPRPPAMSSTWSSSSSSSSSLSAQGLNNSDGTVVVVIARLLPANASEHDQPTIFGYEANNVSSRNAPGNWARGFALAAALPGELTGQTVAGRPAGALGEGCGAVSDGQPPQEAVFGRPKGIDAWRSANLTDKVKLSDCGV